MKKGFLIDFENVKSAGLNGLEKLSEGDHVIVLYSVNSNTISFEMHQKIMQSKATVDYYQIRRGGKNSLDFQLASLLGYLVKSEEYSHLYIVSNDSGFEVLRDFWTSGFLQTECIVYRRTDIAACLVHASAQQIMQEKDSQPQQEASPCDNDEENPSNELAQEQPMQTQQEPQPTPVSEQPKNEEPKDEAQPTEKNKTSVQEKSLSEAEQLEIRKLAVATKGKQEFYRKLIGKYGQKRGLEIYNTAKQDYTSLKKATDTSAKRPEEPKPADERQEAISILKQSSGKQEFYRTLIGKYGQKHGLELYKSLKSDYQTLKKQ